METLTIRAVDELGEQSDYRLILEAMPRHANLILVDREGRIVDCLRRVDFEMSQQRQVLPGSTTACRPVRTSATR